MGNVRQTRSCHCGAERPLSGHWGHCINDHYNADTVYWDQRLSGLPRHLNLLNIDVHIRSMEREYTHNHYVPEWYQRQFLPDGGAKHYYLDLRPDTVRRDEHTYTNLH